jgi:hypothetical protein
MYYNNGAMAYLVAARVCIPELTGSIPLSSQCARVAGQHHTMLPKWCRSAVAREA